MGRPSKTCTPSDLKKLQTKNKSQTKTQNKPKIKKSPQNFHKCCGHKRVSNLVFSGYKVKLAVRLHWAYLWYEHVGTEELQCALPVAQAAAKTGLESIGKSFVGWVEAAGRDGEHNV